MNVIMALMDVQGYIVKYFFSEGLVCYGGALHMHAERNVSHSIDKHLSSTVAAIYRHRHMIYG